MKYYLGPYIRLTEPYTRWTAPEGVLHAIDLRPIPAQADPVNVSGFALFGMPDDIVLKDDYRFFGQGKGLTDIIPTESDRSVFASMCGVQTVDGTTLAEWMYTLLTVYGDVLGDTAVRPLMPTAQGRLGACGIAKQFSLSMPEAAKSILVMQDNYRVMRAEGGETHRKYLDVLGERYNLPNPEDVFIPGDLPKETRLAHETTISDNFNRADSGTLGTAAEGWSWTTVSGSLGIESNQAHATNGSSANCSARAESDLSSTDHYAEATVWGVGGDSLPGCTVRYSASAFTCYQGRKFGFSTSGKVATKRIAGAETELGTASVNSPVGTPVLVRTDISGSVLRVYYDTVLQDTITDTSITSGVRCGVLDDWQGRWSIWEDWTATDGAAGGSVIKSAGSSTVTAASAKLDAQPVSAAGASTVVARGQSSNPATVTAAGAAAASVVGTAQAAAPVSIAGSATVNIVGNASAAGQTAASSAGVATVNIVGASRAAANIQAAGKADVRVVGVPTDMGDDYLLWGSKLREDGRRRTRIEQEDAELIRIIKTTLGPELIRRARR